MTRSSWTQTLESSDDLIARDSIPIIPLTEEMNKIEIGLIDPFLSSNLQHDETPKNNGLNLEAVSIPRNELSDSADDVVSTLITELNHALKCIQSQQQQLSSLQDIVLEQNNTLKQFYEQQQQQRNNAQRLHITNNFKRSSSTLRRVVSEGNLDVDDQLSTVSVIRKLHDLQAHNVQPKSSQSFNFVNREMSIGDNEKIDTIEKTPDDCISPAVSKSTNSNYQLNITTAFSHDLISSSKSADSISLNIPEIWVCPICDVTFNDPVTPKELTTHIGNHFF